MGSEIEALEERLTSMLGQLQTECGILERMVYKNKNQHRRCSYFQYLLKVYFLLPFKKLTRPLLVGKTDRNTGKGQKFVSTMC